MEERARRRGRKKSPAKTETDDSDGQETRLAEERGEWKIENAAVGSSGERFRPEAEGEESATRRRSRKHEEGRRVEGEATK